MQPEETAEVVASAVPSVQQPNAAVSTPEVSIRTKRRSVKVTSSGLPADDVDLSEKVIRQFRRE
jgi:hypothetical protein